ncbi:hypothetical protein B0H17DRAFT_1151571 [Mycena rosella]|uniref:Uncharacterized protein n=1 Tax=Mycena rosella TaxID=1033263 RepID=A0AAD7FIR9_MYCRO|nr:hypothetical protein B0H17DRAFT_1151571 [Mycena rosella]
MNTRKICFHRRRMRMVYRPETGMSVMERALMDLRGERPVSLRPRISCLEAMWSSLEPESSIDIGMQFGTQQRASRSARIAGRDGGLCFSSTGVRGAGGYYGVNKSDFGALRQLPRRSENVFASGTQLVDGVSAWVLGEIESGGSVGGTAAPGRRIKDGLQWGAPTDADANKPPRIWIRVRDVRVCETRSRLGVNLEGARKKLMPRKRPATAAGSRRHRIAIKPPADAVNTYCRRSSPPPATMFTARPVIYAAVETPVIGSGRQRSAAVTNGGPPVLRWSPVKSTGEQSCLLPPTGLQRSSRESNQCRLNEITTNISCGPPIANAHQCTPAYSIGPPTSVGDHWLHWILPFSNVMDWFTNGLRPPGNPLNSISCR